jgi:predicted phosphodiesterase
MNILVLSDLHLSNHDHFSAFGWNEDDFLRKLDLVCTMYGVDRIVLNGDILELCKYGWHEIVKSNGRLLGYFAANDTVYLRGNHDFRAEDGLDHYTIVNSSGQSIHFEHGHKADFFGGTKIGRFLNDALFRGLKFLFGLSPVRTLYFGILHREEGIVGQRKYNSYDYLRYALGLLERHDLVILGHTHEIEAHQSYKGSKSKLYLNCGTCTFGRFQGIVLDSETLRYELIRLQQDDIPTPRENERRPVRFIGRPLPERVSAYPG